MYISFKHRHQSVQEKDRSLYDRHSLRKWGWIVGTGNDDAFDVHKPQQSTKTTTTTATHNFVHLEQRNAKDPHKCPSYSSVHDFGFVDVCVFAHQAKQRMCKLTHTYKCSHLWVRFFFLFACRQDAYFDPKKTNIEKRHSYDSSSIICPSAWPICALSDPWVLWGGTCLCADDRIRSDCYPQQTGCHIPFALSYILYLTMGKIMCPAGNDVVIPPVWFDIRCRDWAMDDGWRVYIYLMSLYVCECVWMVWWMRCSIPTCPNRRGVFLIGIIGDISIGWFLIRLKSAILKTYYYDQCLCILKNNKYLLNRYIKISSSNIDRARFEPEIYRGRNSNSLFLMILRNPKNDFVWCSIVQ